MNDLKIFRPFLTIFFLLLSVTGCALFNDTTRFEINRKAPLPNMESPIIMAGVAKNDITPPPGMPLGGYSIWANYSKGFRTKLFSRVLYLKPASGRALAIVQCDLLSGSVLLNQRVAELISRDTDVGIEGLLIAGTHTHSAPANFFDNNFYNDNASNAAGFDPEYFDFLSRQIADAVILAFKERKPAKIATGKTQIINMTRNRSIDAYHANKNVAKENPPGIHDAVNPDLYMIRVDALDDDGQYLPLAAVSSFSIHPTAVPAQNNLYNGDVFAYIEREVEFGIKNSYNTSWEPIHAAFNGTHADNSPDYKTQGFMEARRLGIFIGRKAFDLFHALDGQLKDDVLINVAATEIDVFSEPCIDGICLCQRPVVGSSLSAGADDGPSPVISKLPWLRQGSPRWFFTGSCQGHKRTLGGPLQSLFLPKNGFPHRMILQTIRIDDFLLLPVPLETTREAGIRIAMSSLEKVHDHHDLTAAFIISCANGYFGYVTTPEEYRLQRYEGGHTLYGPQTQPFLAKHFGKLSQAMLQGKTIGDFPDKWSYRLRSKIFTAGKNDFGGEAGRREIVSDPVLRIAKSDQEPFWSFTWKDMPPHLMAWNRTLVRVEESDDGVTWKPSLKDGMPQDDSGYDIAVTLKDMTGSGSTGIYETRWYNPPSSNRYYRFVILPQTTPDSLYSSPFR
jgi:neutral ceramidase